MESMLAAYGSGAARVSHDEGKRILNIDIGGGTTKLAVVEKGNVIATAAVHIGGRLQVVDETAASCGSIPAGAPRRARRASTGSAATCVDAAALDASRRRMADTLVAALTPRPDAARRRASLSHRSDRRSRPHRRRHVLRRRRRIRLRPRGARFRRHGTAARPRDPPAHRCRRAALAAAAGRRVHPRHRARRLRVQRAALRQHQLHLRARARCCRGAICRCCSRPYVCGEAIDAGRARAGDPRHSPRST